MLQRHSDTVPDGDGTIDMADNMDDASAQRTRLKKLVKQKANSLSGAVTKKLSSELIKALFSELEHLFVDLLVANEEFSGFVEDDPNPHEVEVINGLDRKAYMEDIQNTYEAARRIYRNFLEETLKDEEAVSLKPLQQTIQTISIRLQRSLDIITTSLEDPTSFSVAMLTVDAEELERVLCQMEDLQSKLFEFQHIDVTVNKTEIEDLILSSHKVKRDLKIRLKELTLSESQHGSAGSAKTVKTAKSVIGENSVSVTTCAGPDSIVVTTSSPVSSQSYPSVTTTSPTGTTGSIMSTSTAPTYCQFPWPSSGSVFPPVSQQFGTYSAPTMTGQSVVGSASFSLGGQVNTHMAQSLNSSYTPNPDVKVSRVELPRFSGRRRDWPEFKVLWPQLALPSFRTKETLASQLRKSVENSSAEKLIRSIQITGPQAFDAMWGRLSEFYDDEASSVNDALGRLSSVRPVKEGDFRGLINCVDTVEGCFSQVATLGHLGSLTRRDVDMILVLLPESVKVRWIMQEGTLAVQERLRPFPAFMGFLQNERRTFSGLAGQQEFESTRRGRGVSSHATADDKSVWKPRFYKCVVHKSESKHTTADCNVFQNLEWQEKRETLMGVGACFICFGNHLRVECEVQNSCAECGVEDHHTLLCRK